MDGELDLIHISEMIIWWKWGVTSLPRPMMRILIKSCQEHWILTTTKDCIRMTTWRWLFRSPNRDMPKMAKLPLLLLTRMMIAHSFLLLSGTNLNSQVNVSFHLTYFVDSPWWWFSYSILHLFIKLVIFSFKFTKILELMQIYTNLKNRESLNFIGKYLFKLQFFFHFWTIFFMIGIPIYIYIIIHLK